MRQGMVKEGRVLAAVAVCLVTVWGIRPCPVRAVEAPLFYFQCLEAKRRSTAGSPRPLTWSSPTGFQSFICSSGKVTAPRSGAGARAGAV